MEAAAERLYRLLGARYFKGFAAIYIAAGFLMCALAAVTFTLFQDVTFGKFMLIFGFAETSLMASLALGTATFLHWSRPVQRWLEAGRPPEQAEHAWRTLVDMPPRVFRTQLLASIFVTALPTSVVVTLAFHYSLVTGGLFFIGLIAGGSYPAVLFTFLLELQLRPVLRDLASQLHPQFAAPQAGILTRAKLLYAIPTINLITGGFVAVVIVARQHGSLEDLGVAVIVALAITCTASLAVTLLLLRSVMTPVDGLMRATRSVTEGNLDARVPLLSADEFGTLASSFNQMLGGLAERETLRERTLHLEEEALRVEREREEEARRAVLDERSRIARELHDVVAHSVSVMVVQATAARRVLDSSSQQIAEPLAAIEASGRQALIEMRRFLGVLRKSDDDTLAPQPGISDLSALIAQVREAGLDVELSIEGEPRRLPASLDLSSYRIVQEALTNTMKHASGAHARVRVRYDRDAVLLDVFDDGGGHGARSNGAAPSGHGLVGMRERVALFGGDLEAGPVDGAGFAVRARLPLEAT